MAEQTWEEEPTYDAQHGEDYENETWHDEEDLHGETQRGEGYESETWHDEDQWPEDEW